jgi:hypothetical protein
MTHMAHRDDLEDADARIRSRIAQFFVESNDFNGIAVTRLGAEYVLPDAALRSVLRRLVEAGQVSLVFSSRDGNAHIKRLPELPRHEQLRRLDTLPPREVVCAYPEWSLVRDLVDPLEYEGRPFSKRLLMGEAQLTPVYFRLEALEPYRRDPRYKYWFNDRGGSIRMAADDPDAASQIILQSFGIGYDAARTRVVSAYLRYLAKMPPDHQQIWNAQRVDGPCTMNSAYERATIDGDWSEFHSAYEALLQEQVEINKLALLIGKPSFFRTTYIDRRPREFAPMLRPTRSSYLSFVHLLDKMMGENINRAFFEGDVDLEERIDRGGAIELRSKGTVKLLEEWMDSRYTDANGGRVGKELAEPLRRVRKIRQRPAHAIDDDAYDPDLPRQQDELVGDVVRGMTKLRLVLMSHPDAKGRYAPPAWLDGGQIVFF